MKQPCAELRPYLSALRAGTATHAVLLTAESSELALEAARELAAAILCRARTADGACGHCQSCRLLESQSHPDLHWLQRGQARQIAVERVREEIIAKLYIQPQYSSGAVYLVAADDLNEQGQNALLKSLEEPPPGIYFLLYATAPERLLETVRSRLAQLLIHAKVDLTERADLERVDACKFFSGLSEASIAEVLSRDLNFLLERREEIETYLDHFIALTADLAQLLLLEDARQCRESCQLELLGLAKRLKRQGTVDALSLRLARIVQATEELKAALQVNVSLELALGQYLLTLREELSQGEE